MNISQLIQFKTNFHLVGLAWSLKWITWLATTRTDGVDSLAAFGTVLRPLRSKEAERSCELMYMSFLTAGLFFIASADCEPQKRSRPRQPSYFVKCVMKRFRCAYLQDNRGPENAFGACFDDIHAAHLLHVVM